MTNSIKRVLVVDDTPECVWVFTQLLEKFGCEVVAFGSGEQALALGADGLRGFDAIVTDHDMPGHMNGLKFLTEVRSLGIWCPVAMISGSVDDLLPGQVEKLRGKFFEKLQAREAIEKLVA